MTSAQHKKDYKDFSEHPLAPLFFEYVDILKSRNFHQEAEDLLILSLPCKWRLYLTKRTNLNNYYDNYKINVIIN